MKNNKLTTGSRLLKMIGGGSVAVATALSGALVTLQAQEEDWGDARVVNILQEPRHRTMHHDGDLYVLDVQINPGDQTLPHTHNAAILYTFISNGEGPIGGRVSGNTDYVKENYTHRVSNEGPHLFRIIALTNYGPGLSNLAADRPQGIAGEPQVENEWFRSYRLELAPGEATHLQTHHNPSLVVQVTDGLAHVTRADGITEELAAMGDWAWRDADSPYLVRNIGTEPVAIVINEGRR